MRRLFLILPVLLLAIIVLGVTSGQWLEAERTIHRELSIEASIDRVFHRVGRIRGWRGWYVPSEGDAAFEGPEFGEGGKVVVQDEETGEVRKLVLTETSSPTLVVYRFPKESGAPFDIEGRFELRQEQGKTIVKSSQRLRSLAQPSEWTRVAGERWFLRALSNQLIGSILERELHNLKGAVEGLPPPGKASRKQTSP